MSSHALSHASAQVLILAIAGAGYLAILGIALVATARAESKRRDREQRDRGGEDGPLAA